MNISACLFLVWYLLRLGDCNDSTFFDKYHTLGEITSFLRDIARNHPNTVNLKRLGISHENRTIWAFEIKPPMEDDDENLIPTMWFTKLHLYNLKVTIIECGIHSNEWSSHASCVWIINQVVKEGLFCSQQPCGLAVIPVLNPDGYVYSWTEDRMWKKNRAPTNNSNCPGVDIKWNFGNGLDQNDDETRWSSQQNPIKWSSQQKCLFNPGSKPFSEKESQALRKYVRDLKNNNQVMAYFSIHAFGQGIVFPAFETMGSVTRQVRNFKFLQNVAIRGVEAMYDQNENDYTVYRRKMTEASELLLDYMYYVVGIENTFEIWLPPIYKKEDSITNSTKFHRPPEEIVPTAEELWAGVKAMMKFILSRGIDKEHKSGNSNEPTYVKFMNETSMENPHRQDRQETSYKKIILDSGVQTTVGEGLRYLWQGLALFITSVASYVAKRHFCGRKKTIEENAKNPSSSNNENDHGKGFQSTLSDILITRL